MVADWTGQGEKIIQNLRPPLSDMAGGRHGSWYYNQESRDDEISFS